MSARKTRRITRLRQENSEFKRQLRALVYQPESRDALMIREQVKAIDRIEASIAKTIWFGNYSPKS